jgi:HK97 family phage portal protein
MEQFLRAYGEIGWLHAVVSFIGRSVAEVEWRLNRIEDGEIDEITKPHPIMTLLNEPNPFMSGHDLFELTQIYEDLAGEGYWHLDSEKGKPELWIFPPNRMKVSLNSKEYISGYVYAGPDGDVPLVKEDVIPFITPNPVTPWRGVSPAMAVGVELDTQTYANQTNRFYFYNGATMGLVISYPSDVSEQEYTRLKEQFNSEHRGYGRSHRVSILSGSAGGAPTITQAGQSFGSRDMDFVNMLKNGRDVILAAYGMPFSQLGGSEVNTRATAEAAQVDVARRVLRPRLFKKRDTLNRLLVPKFVTKELPKSAYGLQKALKDSFGYWTADADKRVMQIKSRIGIDGDLTGNEDNMSKVWKELNDSTIIQLDFDNPVPKDVIQNSTVAGQLYQQGISTLNESREMCDLDPVDEGDDFYHAPAPAFPGFGDGERPTQEDEDKPTEEDDDTTDVAEGKGLKKKSIFDTEDKAETYWKSWVKQSETFEPKFLTKIQSLLDATKKEAIDNCVSGITRDTALFNYQKFVTDYEKVITPVMTDCMLTAMMNGYALVEPHNPHKGLIPTIRPAIPRVLNTPALRWLKTRIQWAAKEVGDETEKILRKILADSFEAGEPIAEAAKEIRESIGFDKVRSIRIARTEIMSAHAQGTLDGYKASGFVHQVKFWAAKDERTCSTCMNFHNEVFNIGSEMPIPLHPNCRCVWQPVIPD